MVRVEDRVMVRQIVNPDGPWFVLIRWSGPTTAYDLDESFGGLVEVDGPDGPAGADVDLEVFAVPRDLSQPEMRVPVDSIGRNSLFAYHPSAIADAGPDLVVIPYLRDGMLVIAAFSRSDLYF